MTKGDLLEKLKEEVSADEYQLLLKDEMKHISKPNAKTIINMMQSDVSSNESVDDNILERLRKVTYDYLEEYFAEHREAWKWIYIACAYNTFILEIPMHPKEMVDFKTKEINGKTVYFCPAKTKEDNTNCSMCVCRYMDAF